MLQPESKIIPRWSASRFIRKERGQSLVLITILMIGMVAMLGFVLDGGNAYFQRRRMQNAADASAFAGAIKLSNPGGLAGRNLECAIRYEVEKFATTNGVPGPTPVSGCGTYNTNILANYIDQNGSSIGTYVGVYNGVPSTAKGISVTVQTGFNTFFLGVVGVTSGAASAAAKASSAPLQAPSSLQPLAIPCDQISLSNCFNIGQTYDLFAGSGSGSFGWLSWNGDNDAGYVEDELNPNKNMLSTYVDPHGVCPNANFNSRYNGTQCWVEGLSGVNNSSGDKAQMDAWKAKGLAGKPMIIPIYDASEGTGSGTNYRVAGFAAFILEDYSLSAKWVRGRFVEFTVPGKLCTSSCFDSGLTGLHLRP